MEAIESEHRKLCSQPEVQRTVEKIATATYSPPSLAKYQSCVRRSKIPVLLYWVTHVNVIVWVVSPDAIEIKKVFLPEVAVIHKVGKLNESIRTAHVPFDENSARELHTYLIKPFEKHLSQQQVIIIPQGPLVDLPFEALIDATTGKFLIEKLAISYAPNAAFAMRALEAQLPKIKEVLAV